MSSFTEKQHIHDPLPEKLRIVQLAKLLEVPAGEVLKRVQAFDSEPKSVLSSISPDITRKVLIEFQDDRGNTTGAPDPQAVDDLLATIGGDEAEADRHPLPWAYAGSGVRPDESQATVDDDESARDEDPPPMDHDDPGADMARPSLRDHSWENAPERTGDEDPSSPLEDFEREQTSAAEETFGMDRGFAAEAVGDEDPDHEREESAQAPDPITQYDRTLSLEGSAETGVTHTARVGGGGETAGRSGIKRRGMLLVATAIILGTTLIAGLYAFLRPSYAAESEVVVAISGLGPEEIQRELQSFSVFAASQTVLAPVAEQFDLTVSGLRESLTSTIVGDSTVLRFTVVEDDPDTALALNEAIVASYLEVANQPIDQDELAFVESRIAQTQESIDEIDSALSQLEAEEAANASLQLRIDTDRDVAQVQLSDLQGRIVDLQSSGAAPPGSINYVQGQITEAETRLADLVAQAQALEQTAASTRSSTERHRSELAVLRAELSDLEALKVDLELDQISGTRAKVFAPGHVVDEPVGLTPTRAVALGLLVGGALAYAWIFAATQFRRTK